MSVADSVSWRSCGAQEQDPEEGGGGVDTRTRHYERNDWNGGAIIIDARPRGGNRQTVNRFSNIVWVTLTDSHSVSWDGD
jgi:hypothetical protein